MVNLPFCRFWPRVHLLLISPAQSLHTSTFFPGCCDLELSSLADLAQHAATFSKPCIRRVTVLAIISHLKVSNWPTCCDVIPYTRQNFTCCDMRVCRPRLGVPFWIFLALHYASYEVKLSRLFRPPLHGQQNWLQGSRLGLPGWPHRRPLW